MHPDRGCVTRPNVAALTALSAASAVGVLAADLFWVRTRTASDWTGPG